MLVKDNNDIPTIQSNKAMDKAQEIANKILRTTPHLIRQLPNDSVFRNGNPPTATSNTTQMPAIKKPDNVKDAKKKGSTIGNTAQTAISANTFSAQYKPDLSAVDWQKKYMELEGKYKRLEEDSRLVQYDKDEKERRYVKREEGYRKLVDELHEELRRDFSLNGNEKRRMEEIAGLHTKIIDNINNIQVKTSKVLLDQEKDIIRFFNNKINEIKKQFEEERIKRSKKDQSYEVKEKQLIAELEWIKDIAQKIDQENHTLMKKYMDLKAQYSTQENDREILLREVILKKKKNAILKSQIEQYEKVLDDVAQTREGQNDQQSFIEDEGSVEGNQENISQEHVPLFNASHADSFKKRSQISSAAGPRNVRINTAGTNVQGRAEGIINKLKMALVKEKKKTQQLKTLYIKELESKSILEKVLRGCIEDVKDDIFTMQKDKISSRKFTAPGDSLDKKERTNLIEKLINDERILTLIYDKTFYASNKKIEIPPELLRDDDDGLEGIL